MALRDILQINSTIIAGALILLTINASTDFTQNAFNRYAITIIVTAIILPFAGSSLWAFNEKTVEGARKLTQWGFLVLMVGLTTLGALVAVDQFTAEAQSVNTNNATSDNDTATQSSTNIDAKIWASPDFWVAVGTGALAIATFLFLLETRKARIANQKPSIALEPTQWALGGTFSALNLVNHGQPATDIFVKCSWLTGSTDVENSLEFYIISLAKDGYAGLSNLPVGEIVTNGNLLKVEITCKDSVGKPYKTTITNGFDKITGNTRIAYQNNSSQTTYDALDRIGKTLRKIEDRLDKLSK